MPDGEPEPSSASTEAGADGAGSRQRVVRMRGSRRAKLTPAPGTHAEPDERDRDTGAQAKGAAGPNDAALHREVPPHY